MLNSLPVRLFWHSLNWLSRIIVVVSVVAAVLIAASIMVLRYWLLPNIEQYHDRITSSLSATIGSPVTIGRIQGEWRGFMPRLNFADVRILDDQRQPALVLKSIDGSLSWMSLLTAQLRLASLEIDTPKLLLHRDVEGKLFIGNLALSRPGDNNDISDWLLHQSDVVVRNALIVWVDDQRKAPPLVLQQVNLHIRNLFGKHSFALQAVPPGNLSTPLDVRGEFYGGSFDNLSNWHGQLYTRLDYTDVTAWRPWLDLPGEFSQGRGALRGWLGISGGKVTQITADMDLRDVVTQLDAAVPELKLTELRGRAAWHQLAGGFEFSTTQLLMKLQDGPVFQPTDFYFRIVDGGNKQHKAGIASGGEIRANLLPLNNLADLAKYLPMDTGMRSRLDGYAPKGKVSDLDAQWQGSLESPDTYKLKGHFDNLAINRLGKMPGFSGLTGDVEGSNTSGRLSINARKMIIDAPDVMREPLSFSTLIGQAGWRRKNGEWSINVDNIAVANDDLAGNLYGSYLTQAGTLGVLDLTGRLTRGNISSAARYTPLIALNREGNDWLNGALLAGHTEDFRIRIKGNLSDFPPGGHKAVLFEIGGHAQDAVLEFDKSWPRIKNISGELLIQGNKLEVRSPTATILDTHLLNVTVTIPDMMSKNPSLEIKGDATGPSNSFLAFIQKSPVHHYINGFTDGVSAKGNASLDLTVNIPLSGNNPAKVSGVIKVQDNDIDLGKGVPLLQNTAGALQFTESGMHANDISSEILGGKASISVQSDASGGVHATVKGRGNMDVLRKIEPYPLLDYLHGSANWEAAIDVVNKSTQVTFKSDLQGISSALPKPFAKSAKELMPLRVERKPDLDPIKSGTKQKPCKEPCTKIGSAESPGREVITARLGGLVSARIEQQSQGGEMKITHGLVRFGERDQAPRSAHARKSHKGNGGIWLVGNLPELSVEGWAGLIGDEGSTAKGNNAVAAGSATTSTVRVEPVNNHGQPSDHAAIFPIAGANLRIGKLTGYGQMLSELHVTATRRGDGLAARLSSSALNGELVWEPHGYNGGSMVRARLSNLQWLPDQQSKPTLPAAGQPEHIPPVENGRAGKINPANIPALDISIENLQVGEKHIGHFELIGHPEDHDWRLRRLNITNPDGSLVGDGVWSDTQGLLQTQLNLLLNISNAGKILARSGYPNTVRGGSGKLEASLSWAGTPGEFSYDALNGTLKLDTGKGQFLKMDPGAGKLLSILSLQDLPKHISLGFTDVFSEGFQFDNINGNATIKNGIIDSQDFRIYGSSAKVTLKGQVDLKKETQDLKVRILPTLGDSVSMIGAFAISPVVGIGSLIVNKVLGNPLDTLASFEYNVNGSWRDPNVVRVGGSTAESNQPKSGK